MQSRTNSRFRYFCLIILFLRIFSSCTEKLPTVQKAEEILGVEIVANKDYQSTRKRINYKKVSDTAKLSIYIDILVKEFQKYPPSYFDKMNLDRIVLCDDLTVLKQRRAGYPNPYKNSLVLSIDSLGRRIPYLIHVMHHELHHCTEYSLYGSMYHHSEEWLCLNEPDFMYGNGGVTQYTSEGKKINWYWLTHPTPSFPNRYGTLGQEEDRAELMALLMNKSRRDTLVAFCKTDTLLRKKVLFLINELNEFSKTKSNYWETTISELLKERSPALKFY